MNLSENQKKLHRYARTNGTIKLSEAMEISSTISEARDDLNFLHQHKLIKKTEIIGTYKISTKPAENQLEIF
jgi:hypothetical protein